ncbi:DUF2501 domain-containing protein [Scandinavium manionii]|uniref:DUF2501 domain-containing protein n=1 Tax=Scandinavium manionii TaxID=2926520 RepID=UPI0013585BB3|nr:DUF2501 domain-containing protein [Scandinavium manionii]MCS2149285.1 DUF2501 domain-containing protein [Scandinavium manionii]MCS2165275.1 DUF2501 domain-containing protein [Scandinavium manionii]
MNTAKRLLCTAALTSALLSTSTFAISLSDTLSSAASELGGSSTSSTGTTSLSSLTSLLSDSGKALSADNMNNAAGILSYCAQQKLTSVTDTENVKNQVLDKLGLDTAPEQKADTNYMDGIQGLLNAQNGQQLNLSSLGDSDLGKQVKTKACDLVLKQGANFLS